MTEIRPLLPVIALLVALLQGCAAAVVGGAATGTSVAHDRRSAGTMMDDEVIEMKILSNSFQDDPLRSHTDISATSYNYVVLLTGQAETAEYRNQFVELARRTPMVKQVISEVEIEPAAGWTETSKDAYITSKVKLALFEIKLDGFDPSRVKVVTEKKVVYLMGMVTPTEANEVVEKVRHVRDVKQVVKAFEYLR